jgi:hypothetical protein
MGKERRGRGMHLVFRAHTQVVRKRTTGLCATNRFNCVEGVGGSVAHGNPNKATIAFMRSHLLIQERVLEVLRPSRSTIPHAWVAAGVDLFQCMKPVLAVFNLANAPARAAVPPLVDMQGYTHSLAVYHVPHVPHRLLGLGLGGCEK